MLTSTARNSAALSFVLPLCVITIHEVVTIPAVQSTPQVFESAMIGTTAAVEVSEPIWPHVLCVICAIGAFGVLAMTIISIIKVIGIIAGGEHRTLESGETLVISDETIAPFSWMKYIVLSREDYESGYSVANSFNHSTLKSRITMMLNKKSSRKGAWKALYVLPLVGISLAATAETKVDYQYEGQQPEAVADTLGNKCNENFHKVSSGEPTSFRKKNLYDGKIITDLENNMLTVIFYNVDGKECKTQFIGINLNEDIYIHNGVYADEAIFNKVAAEDPEAVMMVGYLKNNKKVRVVVTPSEVYVTGRIVITREQEEDDSIKVNVRDAE